MRLLFVLIITLSTITLSGQAVPGAAEKLQAASELYQQKKYGKALRSYRESFRLAQPGQRDLLRAAVCAQLAGKQNVMEELIGQCFAREPLAAARAFVNHYEFRIADEKRLARILYQTALQSLGEHYPWPEGERRRGLSLNFTHSLELRFYVAVAFRLQWEEAYQPALYCYDRALRKLPGDPRLQLRAAACAAMLRQQEVARQYAKEAFTVFTRYSLSYVRLHDDFVPVLQNGTFLEVIQEQIAQQYPTFDALLTGRIDAIWNEFVAQRQYPPSLELHHPKEGDFNCYEAIHDPRLQEEYAALRKKTFGQLGALIDAHGVPGPDQVGDRWHLPLMMLKDAPLEFLDQYFEQLVAAYTQPETKYNLGGQELAFAYDAALVRAGKKQRYGTIVLWDKAMRNREPINFYPVEEPRALDKRRMALGLQPHAEKWRVLGINFDSQSQEEYEGWPDGFKLYPGAIHAYCLRQISLGLFPAFDPNKIQVKTTKPIIYRGN